MKFIVAVLAVGLLLTGCGDQVATDLVGPDFDDPQVRAKILQEALDGGNLQRRGGEGGKLWYAVDGKSPFAGWGKYFHDNGQLESLYQFQDGKLNGFLVQWHENGQKKKKGRMLDNEEDGKWTLWYSNGRRQQEGSYQAGKLTAVTVWQPSGGKCPATKVVNGSGTTVWYRPDGKEASRSTYRNGVEVSRLPTVSADDLVHSKKTGLWYFDVERQPFSGRLSDQYEDGAPKGEGSMLEGKKHGRERYWHPNGQLETESHWRNGELHGSFTEWDAKGKVISRVLYAEGKKISKP